MPGLVDLHAHGFQFFDSIGIDFDTACLCRCTTTAVDAGSSGAGNFPGFKKYVIDRCKTRVRHCAGAEIAQRSGTRDHCTACSVHCSL